MSRETHSTVLLLIHCLSRQDSWCGETHIQKTGYFLDKLIKGGIGYDFLLYKHGPYSFDLHRSLIEMRSIGYVELNSHPPYGPHYYLTLRGKKEIEGQSGRNDGIRRCIERLVKWLGSKKVSDLEKLATAYFVMCEYHGETNEDINKYANVMRKLKPHIDYSEAVSSLREVKSFLSS